MSLLEQTSIDSFLNQMAKQLAKQFNSKELEILWSDFKLGSKKTHKMSQSNGKPIQDLEIENEMQKLMMINYHPYQSNHKNQENVSVNKNRCFGKSLKNMEPLSSKDHCTYQNNHHRHSLQTISKSQRLKLKEIPRSPSGLNLDTGRSLKYPDWKDEMNYYKESFEQFISHRNWERNRKKGHTKNNVTERVERQVKDSSVPKLILSRLSSRRQSRASPFASSRHTSQTYRTRINK